MNFGGKNWNKIKSEFTLGKSENWEEQNAILKKKKSIQAVIKSNYNNRKI